MKRERDAYTSLLLESLCPFPMTTTFDEKGKEEEDHEDEGDDGGSSSKNDDDKKITSSSSSFAAVPKAKVSVSRLLCVVVVRLEKAFLNPLSLTPNALSGSLYEREFWCRRRKRRRRVDQRRRTTTTARRAFFLFWRSRRSRAAKRGHDD